MSDNRVEAIKIEPGQGASRCKLCLRTIYWGATHNGKPVPVSINGQYLADSRPPTRDKAGVGINHFIDCPTLEHQRAILHEEKEREKRVLLEQTELPFFVVSRNTR